MIVACIVLWRVCCFSSYFVHGRIRLQFHFTGSHLKKSQTEMNRTRFDGVREKEEAADAQNEPSRACARVAKGVAALQDAASILILGPGEAKSDLQKRLERQAGNRRIVAIQRADKLTDSQLAAPKLSWSLLLFARGQSVTSLSDSVRMT
jgi:hypothetical protein